MARTQGFADLNPYAYGAGVVLPDSEAENYAIENVGKLQQQQQYQQRLAQQRAAQANKDFATNKLSIKPGLLFNGELQGLAQKWYDKGVQYRRQQIDPWNVNWNDPQQAKIAEEHLGDQQHILALAGLRDALDKDYNEKQKLAQEGKVEGFDEYDKYLRTHSLQDIEKAGGINAIPQLYPKYDEAKVDEGVTLKADERTVRTPTGVPGVDDVSQEKYLNMQNAARTVESRILNQPGVVQHFQKIGIGNPNDLYTKGGHFMTYDNPEHAGEIDQKALLHAMSTEYLTEPDKIRQLPASVKAEIVGYAAAKGIPMPDGSKVTADGKVIKPFDASQNPDYRKFIIDKFHQQLSKEAAYQEQILNGITRKLPELGSTEKYDATLAHLDLAKKNNYLSQVRTGYEGQRLKMEKQKWAAKVKDTGTRERWINGIQAHNPGDIADLAAAVKEVHGRVVPTKTGIAVEIPETVPNVDAKGHVNTVTPKKQVMHTYPIDKNSGRPGRIIIEQIINKLPTFGKEKDEKVEPDQDVDNEDNGGTFDDF